MKRISVFVAAQQHEEFMRLSRETGRRYSELIREALDRYLQEQRSRAAGGKTGRKRAVTRKRP